MTSPIRAVTGGNCPRCPARLGADKLHVVADRGYFESHELKTCEGNQVITYVPNSPTSGNQAKGLFGKRDFIYRPDDDEYECPAGRRLIFRFSREEREKVIRRYWTSGCPACPLKSKCTSGDYRRVSRWEHEDVLERVVARLDAEPDRMKARRETVEHPFGTLKAWMGYTHFQMKTLKRKQHNPKHQSFNTGWTRSRHASIEGEMWFSLLESECL